VKVVKTLGGKSILVPEEFDYVVKNTVDSPSSEILKEPCPTCGKGMHNFAGKGSECQNCGCTWTMGSTPKAPKYLNTAPKIPAKDGLEMVLVDKLLWETGTSKASRNVQIRMRLHEDPETLTFGLANLWDEFFDLMAHTPGSPGNKVLNSDVLAALAQKMLEIETARAEFTGAKIPSPYQQPTGPTKIFEIQKEDGTLYHMTESAKLKNAPKGYMKPSESSDPLIIENFLPTAEVLEQWEQLKPLQDKIMSALSETCGITMANLLEVAGKAGKADVLGGTTHALKYVGPDELIKVLPSGQAQIVKKK
jgi:hypothetical protein